MSEAEKKACIAIGNGRYLPGTWDKKFARKMAEKATQTPDSDLSEKQRDQIRRIMQRYRRSVKQVTF